jgi:hypothetical protein
MKVSMNANIVKICAFCKHWHDPAFLLITPKQAKANVWEFDTKSKALCLEHNMLKQAQALCSKFESRVKKP